MIRRATVEDVPRIVAMGVRFAATPDYAAIVAVKPEMLETLARNVLANPDGVIFVAERDGTAIGMIALITYPHPLTGERVACELVWWVEPDARGVGVRLLRTAERWAKEHGAAVLHMIAPNARVGQFYHAVGYEPIESTWQRRM